VRRPLSRVLALVTFTASLAVIVASASAWVVSTPYPQTVRVERETDDYATTATVLVYMSALNGPTQAQTLAGSWDETGSGTPFTSGIYYTVDFDTNSWSVDLSTINYGSALVVTPVAGGTQARTVVGGLNSRQPVTLVSSSGSAVPTLPVSLPSTYTVTLSPSTTVSLDQSSVPSISIPGTVTIGGGVPRDLSLIASILVVGLTGSATAFLYARRGVAWTR